MKEAAARIKINKLLDESGWRFFDDPNGPANISLEAKSEDKNPLSAKERALVNPNRKLITRMEAKIQPTLSRIWGEEKTLNPQ